MKTIKELNKQIEQYKKTRPMTKDELKKKYYREALKDMVKLIDEWWIEHFPQTGDEPLRELKKRIIG